MSTKAMTLKEYVECLSKIATEHPDFLVVSQKDEEGEVFHRVYNFPIIGNYAMGDFMSEQCAIDGGLPVNAVCVS